MKQIVMPKLNKPPSPKIVQRIIKEGIVQRIIKEGFAMKLESGK
jgi:hypothetical protein